MSKYNIEKKKSTHGGARPGSGPKLIYGEKTERLYVSVPVSKKEEIQKKIADILVPYMAKQIK